MPAREKLQELARGKTNERLSRDRAAETWRDHQRGAGRASTIAANLAAKYPNTDAGHEPDVQPIAAAELGRSDLQLFQRLWRACSWCSSLRA